MKISLEQLEDLLLEQKRNVINNLMNSTSYYNDKNSNGDTIPIVFNKEKFKEVGMAAELPKDFITLVKYNVK